MGAERFAGSIGNSSFSLADAKAARCAEVIACATRIFNAAIAKYSPGELAGWPILRSEADAYAADPSASIPNIVAEAQFRGCAVATLVQKVQVNTQFFDALRAQIAGNSGKHRDAISMLTDFDAIANYDYSAGWPAV